MNQTLNTLYCPDCVLFYKDNNFLCSFYELQEDGTYKGGINLYELKEDSKPIEINSLNHTGIFDF